MPLRLGVALKPWWNWRDAVLGKVTPAYRETFLQQDISRARIVIAGVAIMVLGFIYADYMELRAKHPFYLLAVLRIAFLSTSFWLASSLPKYKNANFADYSILTWSMAMVFLSMFSTLSRNTISVENININHMWVLGFYLVLPNRQPFKVIPALTVTIFSIYILFNYKNMSIQGINNLNIFTNVSNIIAINIIGFLSSLQYDAQRYHHYLIQKTLIAGRDQLRELAITDSLTGTLNRRGFLQIADSEFDRFKRYGDAFSFVIFDLDNLKTINDTFGHPAGDLAIQTLVKVIDQEKRSLDTIGRLAGDEFSLLLPNTNPNQTLEVMSRIKNLLKNTALELSNEQELRVSFSAGVTEAIHSDETFDDIYRRADKALLSAKNKGRNTIEKA